MKTHRNYIICLLFFGLISSVRVHSQREVSEEILLDLVTLEFEKAESKLAELDDSKGRQIYEALIRVIKNRGRSVETDSAMVNKIELRLQNDEFLPIKNLILGYFTIYNESENFEALTYFDSALQIAEKTSNEGVLKLSLSGIIELYTVQVVHNTDSHLRYIKRFKELSNSLEEQIMAKYYETNLYGRSIYSPREFLAVSNELKNLISKTSISSGLKSRAYENIAVYYRVSGKKDSASLYNQKILALPENSYHDSSKFKALLELAALEASKSNAILAKDYVKRAELYINRSDSMRSMYKLEKFKSHYVHRPLKEYDSAYYYLNKSMLYEVDQDFKSNKEKVAQLNVQLRTSEKERELLLQDRELKRNRNIALSLGGLLFFGTIIFILDQRNNRKKRQIAEQQREIEINRSERLLKEQELSTINAMISGQEKERQRLASDLHDSVGATLSAAKLQFEHLNKHRNSEGLDELFDKTSKLLDNAYNEVRNMAHAKNSGVIAKQSLLPAVKKLARNASVNTKLNIEVADFGLDERLENSVEISVFRIIQELVTNIIKHADATEATIAITQHDDSINLIIEDNGKGFNSLKTTKTDGMGLHSIEQRIEYIEGSMEIDSSLGNGTSIIIDIPI